MTRSIDANKADKYRERQRDLGKQLGWTGLGYKRNAWTGNAKNGGTPGYTNNALRLPTRATVLTQSHPWKSVRLCMLLVIAVYTATVD